MINILNFAAVPFNSPVYQRTEEMMMEVAREEMVMEVARELQDLESDLSRILSRDSPFRKVAASLICLLILFSLVKR